MLLFSRVLEFSLMYQNHRIIYCLFAGIVVEHASGNISNQDILHKKYIRLCTMKLKRAEVVSQTKRGVTYNCISELFFLEFVTHIFGKGWFTLSKFL